MKTLKERAWGLVANCRIMELQDSIEQELRDLFDETVSRCTDLSVELQKGKKPAEEIEQLEEPK